MPASFQQIEWDAQLEDDCLQLIRLAAREDLDRHFDWTTLVLVPAEAIGAASVVARAGGALAGLPAARLVLSEYDRRLQWTPLAEEGATISAGQAVARVEGPARSLLAAERPMLNLLGHVTGIATLTRPYVEAVRHTKARVYDTRKTTPGYRRLEKYAVRQGGAWNHRLGLYDAVLIKDNHLAWGAEAGGSAGFSPAQAVARFREWQGALPPDDERRDLVVEVEVDSLTQLKDVLTATPDLVLVDNMSTESLRLAVQLRSKLAPEVELEASGGIRLETIAEVAAAGVDRISVGALTHASQWFDFGLDWHTTRA